MHVMRVIETIVLVIFLKNLFFIVSLIILYFSNKMCIFYCSTWWI